MKNPNIHVFNDSKEDEGNLSDSIDTLIKIRNQSSRIEANLQKLIKIQDKPKPAAGGNKDKSPFSQQPVPVLVG